MKKIIKNYPALFFTLFAVFYTCEASAQSENIGLRHSTFTAAEGYTLFSPELNKSVYLINNCGEKVHEWTFSEKPGLTCYLLENGNLLRAGADSLEIRDWENNQIWSYRVADLGVNQHHDIEPLPNGNILCLVTDIYSATNKLQLGRNPSLGNGQFKLDRILELQPINGHDAELVWDWKFADHLIQDYDISKDNFGVVADHPELLNVNFANGQPTDYTHGNAIDYNASLDQIVISARHMNEVYIIDHSTTLFESTGHVGGNYNKGGDFLYRWGNPAAYNPTTLATQKLFLQHDVKWVSEGYPDAGKLSVFNNGGDGTNSHSSVHLIEPTINGVAYEMSNGVFLPSDYSWSWHGSVFGNEIYETKKAGVEQLSNGNMLICETSSGQMIEIDQEGNLIWVYKNPTGSLIYSQAEGPTITDNGIFRAERYPSNYLGFQGKNLLSLGIIEDFNTISSSCSTLGLSAPSPENFWIENPANNHSISVHQSEDIKSISIFDLMGKHIFYSDSFDGGVIQLPFFEGVCFLHATTEKGTVIYKVLVRD